MREPVQVFLFSVLIIVGFIHIAGTAYTLYNIAIAYYKKQKHILKMEKAGLDPNEAVFLTNPEGVNPNCWPCIVCRKNVIYNEFKIQIYIFDTDLSSKPAYFKNLPDEDIFVNTISFAPMTRSKEHIINFCSQECFDEFIEEKALVKKATTPSATSATPATSKE